MVCGHLIKNECIKGSVKVASIVSKMRENRLRWFGHIMKRDDSEPVGVVIEMNVDDNIRGDNWWGSLKKRWIIGIESIMKLVLLDVR